MKAITRQAFRVKLNETFGRGTFAIRWARSSGITHVNFKPAFMKDGATSNVLQYIQTVMESFGLDTLDYVVKSTTYLGNPHLNGFTKIEIWGAEFVPQ